jgi:hypothetical protein
VREKARCGGFRKDISSGTPSVTVLKEGCKTSRWIGQEGERRESKREEDLNDVGSLVQLEACHDKVVSSVSKVDLK